jgi:hypothetical protein
MAEAPDVMLGAAKSASVPVCHRYRTKGRVEAEAHHLVVIRYRAYNDVGFGYLLAGLSFT